MNSTALALLGEDERRAVDAVLGAGLGRLLNVRGQNNLPEPGTLASPRPFSGDYPRLTADP